MDLDFRKLTERAGTFLGIVLILGVGVALGIDVWTIVLQPFSLVIAFFQGSITIALFTIGTLLVGGYVVWDVWWDRNAPTPVRSGPPVRAIVPAYQDAEVLDVSVTSLLDSHYDALEVAVVVEPDDRATRERGQQLADTYEDVTCLVNADPGSKATAINYAVRTSDRDYFAVFDADERISPEFIPGAMGYLLNETDVFQGRRIPRPVGAVETLAYVERIVVGTGYALGELLGFTHCQSSSTAFTRTAFETVDGYDDRLTEDIDFSHKVHQADLTVDMDRSLANTMEAPHSMADLWYQRKRWRIGHVEVVHARLIEAISRHPGLEVVRSVGRALGGVLGGVGLLIVASHVVVLSAVGVLSAFLVPYLTALGIIIAIWSHDRLVGQVTGLSWSVLLMPVVYLGHGILSIKALLEYLLTWDGEWYQVNKTGT